MASWIQKWRAFNSTFQGWLVEFIETQLIWALSYYMKNEIGVSRVATITCTVVQMPNGHIKLKRVSASLWTFMTDSSSWTIPESESGGCQLGILEEFLEVKNKMALSRLSMERFLAALLLRRYFLPRVLIIAAQTNRFHDADCLCI